MSFHRLPYELHLLILEAFADVPSLHAYASLSKTIYSIYTRHRKQLIKSIVIPDMGKTLKGAILFQRMLEVMDSETRTGRRLVHKDLFAAMGSKYAAHVDENRPWNLDKIDGIGWEFEYTFDELLQGHRVFRRARQFTTNKKDSFATVGETLEQCLQHLLCDTRYRIRYATDPQGRAWQIWFQDFFFGLDPTYLIRRSEARHLNKFTISVFKKKVWIGFWRRDPDSRCLPVWEGSPHGWKDIRINCARDLNMFWRNGRRNEWMDEYKHLTQSSYDEYEKNDNDSKVAFLLSPGEAYTYMIITRVIRERILDVGRALEWRELEREGKREKKQCQCGRTPGCEELHASKALHALWLQKKAEWRSRDFAESTYLAMIEGKMLEEAGFKGLYFDPFYPFPEATAFGLL